MNILNFFLSLSSDKTKNMATQVLVFFLEGKETNNYTDWEKTTSQEPYFIIEGTLEVISLQLLAEHIEHSPLWDHLSQGLSHS